MLCVLCVGSGTPFPQGRLRLDRVSGTGELLATALFPFLAPVLQPLRTPPSLPQGPGPPNLELYPLPQSTTSFAEHCPAPGKREPSVTARGSCHHNLNDPSLFVSPLNNLPSPSPRDTLNTVQLYILKQTITNFVASQHQQPQALSLV